MKRTAKSIKDGPVQSCDVGGAPVLSSGVGYGKRKEDEDKILNVEGQQDSPGFGLDMSSNSPA